MPDIAMCSGERVSDGELRICPKRGECYRHVAKSSGERQAWLTAPFTTLGECEKYQPTRTSSDEEK